MRLFYHGNFSKISDGFFGLPLWFILVIIIIGFISFRFGGWNQIKQMFGQGDYKNINLEDLLSYSNLYSGDFICTSGIHAKTAEFSVIKANLSGSEYKNAVLVKYSSGKQHDFESFIPLGMAASVSVCGQFESLRGKEVGTLGVWNNQITIDTYKLLDTPKPFAFN